MLSTVYLDIVLAIEERVKEQRGLYQSPFFPVFALTDAVFRASDLRDIARCKH
jgi:hypothetical protein